MKTTKRASTNSQKLSKELLGVVLCGGKGTRMQGKDKGLVTYLGRPMAAYGIDALSSCCADTIINANRHHSEYQKIFSLTVIGDENNNYDGPLAGMLAALKYAQSNGHEWVISVPCDAPFINSCYVKTMWETLANETSPTSTYRIYVAKDNFIQPVFSLLNIAIIEALEDFLKGPHKKILAFYEEIGYRLVHFKKSELFTNINTIDDCQTLTSLQ